jgi:hypothetical protein
LEASGINTFDSVLALNQASHFASFGILKVADTTKEKCSEAKKIREWDESILGKSCCAGFGSGE